MKQRERKGKRLVCLLKFLLLRKDIKGCYKFAKRREGKNLMDCEFQKKKKRLSNELLQNALKKKKTPVSVRTTCYLSFLYKKEISLFSFFGKFWKNIAKSAFKEIGRKLAEWRK